MATSPNYGWEEPDDTDLVKDGALSIRTMGNAIDSTLGTALNNKTHAGLVLVKTQTIGTAVSSVTVTGAFSSTYENYQIRISGGTASAEDNGFMKLGATSTGYYGTLIYSNYSSSSVSVANDNNGSNFSYIWRAKAVLNAIIDINSPFLTKQTDVRGSWTATGAAGTYQGILNNSTSYTDVTFTPATGTLTGGTIAIYGYAKD